MGNMYKDTLDRVNLFEVNVDMVVVVGIVDLVETIEVKSSSNIIVLGL